MTTETIFLAGGASLVIAYCLYLAADALADALREAGW